MNFLAHAWLAGPEDAYRLGGLLGDFIKGPLPGSLPPAVAEGVRLHRAIDSFAETHPAFRVSRGRVSAARRRVAGIMVDMFYDHFLARHWADYQPAEPLTRFTARQYQLLASLGADLPPRLARILPAMRADDWLASYREVATIALALDRMARRLTRANPLPGAGEELVAGYADFEADFRVFIPDARRFAEEWRRERGR
jgi:acyl carrier protein phosphodiesterase